MTLSRKNRKVREAGAEKARGSVVQEEPKELVKERADWVLLAIYAMSVFIARALPVFGGS